MSTNEYGSLVKEKGKKAKTSEMLKVFKSDLRSAELQRRDLDGKIEKWKAEYEGKPYGNEVKGRSSIVSRDGKRQGEWQHATLIDPFVSTSDIVKCVPITFEDRPLARQTELVLNTQFCRQFGRFNFMTKAIKILDQEGTCVIQTGWEYEDEEVEVEVPIVEINPFDGQEYIRGYEMQKQTKVLVNRPTAKVCRNEDVFIDPTCQDDIDKAQFVIYRYESDISTLKADGRYKNLDKIDLDQSTDSSSYMYESADDTDFKFTDDPRKKLLIYEYWGNFDRNGDGIAEPIVCTWVGSTVIRIEENPFPDKKLPFLVAPFNSVPFTLFGESNMELIGDNQRVKTAILRGIIDNMAQSTNGMKGIKKGALDTINRKKFLAGENFEFNDSPNDFWDGSFNQIPGSAFDMFSTMNNEIESLTGVKSFTQGITGASLGSTATGARGALDATSTRRLNIVRSIAENLVKPLMRKWMAYNLEFLEDEEISRITNEQVVEGHRDNYTGTIDIDIQVSTAEDNAAKAQELGFLMQTMAQSMDEGMRKIIMSEIARLNKMPDLAKMIEEYAPQPDPLQMKIQELQIAKLEAEVINEQAKGQENLVDVELKKAKTLVEQAKARMANSDSDIKDLDFLEREQGIPHQREMERQLTMSTAKIEGDLLKERAKALSNRARSE
jgi:hypothetical protein